jgi:WhiB family transcriptional regulator, redox-sensing transcriptional regulator
VKAAPRILPDTQPAWFADALCRETDPDLWYPDQSKPALPAKRICAMCDVRIDCLRYALEHETRGDAAHGVWGGLTVRERLAVLRRRGPLTRTRRNEEAA